MNISVITWTASVLFLIAAPVYSANADTAWILWEKLTLMESIGKSEWNVVVATDSKVDCTTRIKLELQRSKIAVGENPKSEHAEDTKASIVWIWPGKAGKKTTMLEYNYLCLPDTVDPRHKKTLGK